MTPASKKFFAFRQYVRIGFHLSAAFCTPFMGHFVFDTLWNVDRIAAAATACCYALAFLSFLEGALDAIKNLLKARLERASSRNSRLHTMAVSPDNEDKRR